VKINGEAISPRVWVATLNRSAPSSADMVACPRSERNRSTVWINSALSA
jgi:hypothetical protein